jgi:MFS family permease
MKSRTARWIVTAHFVAIYILATLPTPLYAVYREAFGFSQLMQTVIYAVYVLGSIAAMFLLGRSSDEIGRRPIVVLAAACAIVSAVLFLLATSTAWLVVARIASGIAIAIVAGATTAWLVELDDDREHATRLAIAGNLLGLGLGPLLAGALAQWAPWPMRLPYIVFLALVVPMTVAVEFASETLAQRKPLREVSLMPRIGVPREIRREFAAPALGIFALFAVLGFYAALVPNIVHDALDIASVAAAGAIVAEAFVIGTVVVAVVRRLDARRWLIGSLALLVPGLAMLVLAQLASSLAMLLIGTAVTGVATGLGYRCCLQIVNELAPEEQRAEVVSAFVTVCYIGISIPAVGIGLMATATSFAIATLVFGGVIAAIAIAALAIELTIAHA